jgi:hypothetical protein
VSVNPQLNVTTGGRRCQLRFAAAIGPPTPPRVTSHFHISAAPAAADANADAVLVQERRHGRLGLHVTQTETRSAYVAATLTEETMTMNRTNRLAEVRRAGA